MSSGPSAPRTLLVLLAHPDDEIGCAGTMAAHAAAGDRVILTFLTHGEMTEALGPLSAPEVAARREQHAHEAGRILGCEIRFLDFQDTRVQVTPDANYQVARLIADVKPNAVITWGGATVRGMRHPDHDACGEIARNAITLARIARVVAPVPPHREPAAVFTMRHHYSSYPLVAIDVSAQIETIRALGRFYRERVGWPPEQWLDDRTFAAGTEFGVAAAEVFEAWESKPGLYRSLFDSEVLRSL